MATFPLVSLYFSTFVAYSPATKNTSFGLLSEPFSNKYDKSISKPSLVFTFPSTKSFPVTFFATADTSSLVYCPSPSILFASNSVSISSFTEAILVCSLACLALPIIPSLLSVI